MQIELSKSDPNDHVPDDLVLWRYLDFPKFLDLLSTNSIKMPRASKMEDGFEGMMGLGAIKGSLQAQKQRGAPSYWRHAWINEEQRNAYFWRERTYVSCWNAFPHENAGLWRIYGDDKGLVIRTTWGSLREALTGQSDCVSQIFYGNVVYRDFDSDPLFASTYTDQYFLKRREFVHEKEFRLVAHDSSREHKYEQTSLTGIAQLATVDCNLNTLIEEVLISPRMSSWVRDSVEAVSRRFDGHWDVNVSNLYQPPTSEIMMF